MKQTLTLFFLSIISLVHAQKVQFEGLKRTKASYLLKFMQWDKGVPTDSVGIANGVQRIRNTRFFNEVESRLEVQNGDTVVVFKCQEIITVLPIVEGGASEGNKWIRLGVEDENGLGKGIRTITFYQYNDRHSFLLKQFYPLLYKKWGLGYVLKKWSIIEPLPTETGLQIYNYINSDIEISGHYAFDINCNNLEFGIGYLNEVYEMPIGDMTKMQEVENFKRYLIKGNHHLNYLNHNTFYVNGWSNKLQVVGSYFFDKSLFGSFLNETMFFKTFKSKGNLALRGRVGISSNVNAYLAPFVMDNYYNIRGIGNRIERGTASLTLNAEYRQTVWENRSFALQMVGFTDAGTIRPSGKHLSAMISSQNIKVFSGLGSRFIYKKAFECDLRIDYGVGLIGGGSGFVLGLGQYF